MNDKRVQAYHLAQGLLGEPCVSKQGTHELMGSPGAFSISREAHEFKGLNKESK